MVPSSSTVARHFGIFEGSNCRRDFAVSQALQRRDPIGIAREEGSFSMASGAAPETAEEPRDMGAIRHYHAHVYYDPASSRDRAALLRERVAAAFPKATLGRWHDELVGPHLQSMYQISDLPRFTAVFRGFCSCLLPNCYRMPRP
jgi:hypothetical protein